MKELRIVCFYKFSYRMRKCWMNFEFFVFSTFSLYRPWNFNPDFKSFVDYYIIMNN